jgi:hypothetical protein
MRAWAEATVKGQELGIPKQLGAIAILRLKQEGTLKDKN